MICPILDWDKMTTMTVGAPTLRVQTVLYRPTSGDIDRLTRGFTAAARFARARGTFGVITLAIGDASPQPVIGPALEQALVVACREAGIDDLQYVFYDENQGSAKGQNTLFELRDPGTDFVFVVNPDLYLCPDVLCELLIPFDNPEVGIVEARQLPLEHPKDFDPVDGTTSWASGACMMVRAEVVEEIVGFDAESFFLYCDDVDFSWRARLAGYRIVHRPSARVFHDKRMSANGRLEVSETERYYAAESSLLMAWKYSRLDLVTEWTEELLASSHPEHPKAARTFVERLRAGRLPTQIDPAHSVAEFIGHYYGPYRFGVDV